MAYRQLLGQVGGVWTTYPGGVPKRQNLRASWLREKSRSLSLSHDLSLLGVADVGGPWFLEKETMEPTIVNVSKQIGGFGGEYTGSCAVGIPTNYHVISMPARKSEAQMNALGTTAIAKTEPTESVFAGTNLLGELLKDGLPSIVGTTLLRDKTNLARRSGGEYLNVEFGWKPLIADLKDFLHVVDQSSKIVDDYIADSNRLIRRRLDLGSVTASGGSSDSRGETMPIDTGTVFGTSRTNTLSAQWFSGAFQYSIPSSQASSAVGRFAILARKGLGIELTPEVVWNLAPWSWAADWFGNTGDVMHNVSAIGRDGLLMKWGYVMSETRRESTFSGRTGAGISHSRRDVLVRKERFKGTPYGFGVTNSSLSPRQLAILTAIGLQKTR